MLFSENTSDRILVLVLKFEVFVINNFKAQSLIGSKSWPERKTASEEEEEGYLRVKFVYFYEKVQWFYVEIRRTCCKSAYIRLASVCLGLDIMNCPDPFWIDIDGSPYCAEVQTYLYL